MEKKKIYFKRSSTCSSEVGVGNYSGNKSSQRHVKRAQSVKTLTSTSQLLRQADQ